MSERAHVGLDNPVFSGRLRRQFNAPASRRPRVDVEQKFLTDYVAPKQAAAPPAAETAVFQPALNSQPKARQPDTGQAAPSMAAFVVANATATGRPDTGYSQNQAEAMPLKVELEPIEEPDDRTAPWPEAWQAKLAASLTNIRNSAALRHYSPLQLSLLGMACLVFMIGLMTSLQTMENNHNAAAQVSALLKHVNSQTAGQAIQSSVPSITKPSAADMSRYAVAPDMARYIRIPKLGVYARVTQVGVTDSGTLGMPANINDTGWYSGSAKPGQPGATLVEGHVASGLAAGVFYDLKALAPGDMIQIERGDGTIFNYQVVKTQTYAANNVDMQAAVTPVTAGRAGLNLITCEGQAAPGGGNGQRLIVFAQQI